MMKKVQVLLSSYNGEKYIGEQIDSILRQKNVLVSLLIRDDGSKDGTCDIISEYEKKHFNIKVIYGSNVGVINSFFELANKADNQSDFYAFADQDDVWLPDKLSRAVSYLEEEEKVGQRPLVYCSSVQLVDASLQPIKSAITYREVRPVFGNALVENMCRGCTSVFNKELLALLRKGKPKFTVMHDFWVYLLGSCFGKVIYDSEGRILYRKHGNNELGAASNIFENYWRRVKYFKKHRGQLALQAKELLRIHGGDMDVEKKKLVVGLCNYKKDTKTRRWLLQSHSLFRQRKKDDFIFRWLFRLRMI